MTWSRRRSVLLSALGALAFAATGVVWIAARGEAYSVAAVRQVAAPEAPDPGLPARLARLSPRGIHVVVDTYGGRLRVYEGERLLRDATCSTGSGSALRDPRDGRLWVFETPIGERRVERKVADPVWSKPDWAFVEEGRVPPPPFDPDRWDDVSLGDYALYLGDGYLIHGTLFQSTLGRRMTHGCIRLGDEDLEWVYRTVPVGARVWLY